MFSKPNRSECFHGCSEKFGPRACVKQSRFAFRAVQVWQLLGRANAPTYADPIVGIRAFTVGSPALQIDVSIQRVVLWLAIAC